MSLPEMESPDKARPEEASAIQTDEPEAPGPVQPAGKLATAEAAEAAAEVMVLAAPAIAAVRSAFKLVRAEGRAKRVNADDPPHMVVLSPLQAMLPLVEVFDKAAPLERTFPQ
jgi:hypothetical protein